MSMKLKDVRRFIRKFTNKRVWIRFLWESESWGIEGASAYAFRFEKPFSTNMIVLNRNTWRFRTRADQKSILLHELGHIQSKNGFSKSKVEAEFSAHRWAMRKARQFNMKMAYRELVSYLDIWRESPWNSEFRAYRMMAIRVEKEKVI